MSMDDLISRKALMKNIAHHTVHDSMSVVTFERSTVYEMVKGDMFGLVKDAPAVAAMPRWISVEERLPEYDIDVLVCATGDFGSVITITSYSDNLHGFNIKGWVSPWQYFHKNYTITHWMPLPQPPEEPA
jgi:hypothetical protein